MINSLLNLIIIRLLKKFYKAGRYLGIFNKAEITEAKQLRKALHSCNFLPILNVRTNQA